MKKGSLTSKSLGDLPGWQDNDWVQKKPSWEDEAAFDDHWTDQGAPRKDDDDRDAYYEDDLPEPQPKPSRFNLFGSNKKVLTTTEGEKLRGPKYGTVRDGTPSLEDQLDDIPTNNKYVYLHTYILLLSPFLQSVNLSFVIRTYFQERAFHFPWW